MAEDPKNPPEKTENTASNVAPEEEVLLDKTRMDMDISASFKEDPTSGDGGTDIRVNSGLHSKPKPPLFSGLTAGLKTLINSLARAVGKIKAPTSMVSFLSRLGIVLAALPLFYLLGQSTLFAFKNQFSSQWILLGVLALAVLFSVVALLLRWAVAFIIAFPLISILGLLTAHFLLYPGTDPLFFTLIGHPPSLVANEIWAAFFGVEILCFLLAYPGNWFAKGLFAFLLAGAAGNFLFNIFSKVPLEASWAGVRFLARLPLLAEPGYLTLVGLLPFLFLASLLWLIFSSTQKGWISANLIVLLVAVFLGQVLLQKNRLPNLIGLISPPPLPAASAVLKGEGAGFIQVSTKNFKAQALHDDWDRARFTLSAAKDKYLLTATNADGFPLLLKPSDLSVTVGGNPVKWKMLGNKKGYLISLFSQPAPTLPFAITVPEKKEYAPTEQIQFVLPPDTDLDFYEISVDGHSEGRKEPDGKLASLEVSLAGLTPGNHSVEVSATDQLGNLSRASLAFTLVVKPGLQIQTPQTGDSFSDSLPVALDLSVPAPLSAGAVHFLIDEQEVGMKDSPPYQAALDTTGLAVGNHVLKVSVSLANPADPAVAPQEFFQSVPIVKGDHPQAFFVRPTLGEFLAQKTPVEISVAADSKGALPTAIELWLNETKIHDWSAPPYTFDWDTSGLASGEYVLKLKAKTADGVQTSDWVKVLTGEGNFQINSQSGDLHYQKVVFILDASISESDLWGTKPKWEWLQGLFSATQVSSELKGAEVGVILSGDQVFYQHADCRDVHWVMPMGPANSRSIRAAMKKAAPKGVFSLFTAVDQALAAHPKKIIVLADGADACTGKIPAATAAKIKREEVSLDVLTLGKISADEEKVLQELAETGGGEMKTVSNGGALDDTVADALAFNFKVMEGDKTVLKGPVDDSPHPLRPGTYQLKISMDPPMPEKSIAIRHGATTTIDLGPGGI